MCVLVLGKNRAHTNNKSVNKTLFLVRNPGLLLAIKLGSAAYCNSRTVKMVTHTQLPLPGFYLHSTSTPETFSTKFHLLLLLLRPYLACVVCSRNWKCVCDVVTARAAAAAVVGVVAVCVCVCVY